jgi:hypothetical protein
MDGGMGGTTLHDSPTIQPSAMPQSIQDTAFARKVSILLEVTRTIANAPLESLESLD